MTITAEPGQQAQVIALTPDEFLRWAKGRLRRLNGVKLPPPWQPGQHVALIGKTREGKTNFAVWLLGALRLFVAALDPKGEDESLSASGWVRVSTVPGGTRKPAYRSEEWRKWERIHKTLADNRALDEQCRQRTGRKEVCGQCEACKARKPVRIIVGQQSRTRKDDALNRLLMRDAIEWARQVGGLSLYVDEHQILSDRRMFGLGEDIARQAISAARDKMSVVASMQYMAWVEKAATRQATLIALWRTRDRDLIKLAAQTAGRPWQEVAAAVDELPKYWLLLIPDELRAPMLMVRPPKVT